jgi:hypothetical protein
MIDQLIGKAKQEKQAEKKMEKFIPEVSEEIKVKLQTIAIKGQGTNIHPKIITLDEIRKAFNEWKLENQIFNHDLTLSNCKELSLSFQKILQISNLENLVKLEKLKLDNNIIMKIENLEKLTNLNWLDLSFNTISKMEGLNTLTKLLDLSLYNNQICEVEGLDNCRSLHVLSIGMNQIRNCKEMVAYLKKFSNLEALNVADNPFSRDDSNTQVTFEQQMQQKSIYYPSSYDPILAHLSPLKYLDWKPIDEDKRSQAKDNNQSNQKDKIDTYANDEKKQKALRQEYDVYKKANIEATIDFYNNFVKKLKDDLDNNNSLETWDKFGKLKNFNETMDSLSKNINASIKAYRENVLKIIESRNELVKKSITEIEVGHKKFVNESKALVSVFKRFFKSQTLGKTVTQTEIDKIQVEIKNLTDKLMEIYIYEKKQIEDKVKDFRVEYKKEVDKVSDETSSLKNNLDSHKTELKDSLLAIKQEIEKKWQAYQSEEEGHPQQEKNEEYELLVHIYEDESIWVEMEKINDTYEEKFLNLVNINNPRKTNLIKQGKMLLMTIFWKS